MRTPSRPMPDWPPSPPTDSNQFDVPRFHHVPLSWVPPWRSSTFRGFSERLWNWIVARPLLSLVNTDGTADSHAWQSTRSGPTNPRVSQRALRLVNDPLVRMTPPSDPTNEMSGLL